MDALKYILSVTHNQGTTWLQCNLAMRSCSTTAMIKFKFIKPTMRKEKITIIKIIPFFVPLKNGTLTVYGKIYTVNKSICWDVNYHFRPSSNAGYYRPSKCSSSVEQAEKTLNAYIKCFTEDYVYNDKF